MDEDARVHELKRIFEQAEAPPLVGIGDDAAVLRVGQRDVVWTVDTQIENVHFRRSWLTLEELGYRATMAAASDLAAMAARPLGLLSAVALPESVSADNLFEIARGQARAANELGCSMAGGNLSKAGELSITTTALGELSRPALTRGGATNGDGIWVSGALGLARAGYLALDRGLTATALIPAIHAWKSPRAQIQAGLALPVDCVAGMDISDGLTRDAARLARASNVTLLFDEARLETPELVAAALALNEPAWELAMTGGEDYALMVLTAADLSTRGFRRIGETEPQGKALVLLRDKPGHRRAPTATGWDHFLEG